jgi:O-antigen/teichoic acid export membrane protein
MTQPPNPLQRSTVHRPAEAFYQQDRTPSVTNLTRIPTLRANFIWTFAGNVVYAGCQWGMLSVLAKLGNPAIVGQFTLGLAVSAPILMFTNLQLRALQASDVNREREFADYFTHRLLATLLGLIAILVLVPFDDASNTVRMVILLVSLSKCVDCMSDVTAGLLQREEKLKRVAVSLMIRGAGSVLLFALTFACFRNLALSVASMCAVWLAVFLFFDLSNVRALIGRHKSLFRFDRKDLWQLTTLGLPLGWITTLTSLNANIPRYFLTRDLGLSEQGIYSSLAYLVIAVGLLVAALSQSVITRLARLFADGDLKQFVRLLTKLSMLGIVIPALGIPSALLVGKPLLTLLYRREYADHVDLLVLFMGTAGINAIASFLFCGMNAARSYKILVPVYFASTVIGVAVSAILIPRCGLMGAGFAMLLSALATALGGYRALHITLKERAAKLNSLVWMDQ